MSGADRIHYGVDPGPRKHLKLFQKPEEIQPTIRFRPRNRIVGVGGSFPFHILTGKKPFPISGRNPIFQTKNIKISSSVNKKIAESPPPDAIPIKTERTRQRPLLNFALQTSHFSLKKASHSKKASYCSPLYSRIHAINRFAYWSALVFPTPFTERN